MWEKLKFTTIRKIRKKAKWSKAREGCYVGFEITII